MAEKSGIDMIEELLKKVEIIDKRYTIIEQMLKELLNRANGFETKPVPVANCAAPTIKPTGQAKIVATNDSAPKPKVLGKVKAADGKMLGGISVKILDGSGNTIKKTKTNRAGEWLAFLPIGQYKAEYEIDKQRYSVSFNIKPDQKLIRVAQPQQEG